MNTYLLKAIHFRVGLLSASFLVLLIASVSASGVTPDRSVENNLLRAFFRNLYDFSLQKADSIVTEMENKNADRSTLLIARADLAWWRLLSGDDPETNLKICGDCIDESIKTNQHIAQPPDINALFNIIYSYSLKVRLENYKGNSLSAFINFYKSSAYIEKCRGKNIADEKFTLVLGMYYYFISYIQHKYFLLDTFLFSFPEGDREKGLSYLISCSGSADDIIRTEADYFLMKIYAEAEKDYSKALDYAKVISNLHPGNPVYSLEELKLLIKTKQYDEAAILSEKIKEGVIHEVRLNNDQKEHFVSQILKITKRGLKK